MDNLAQFLSDPTNSVTREKLIYNRFYYDLKIAAARAGYALTMYEPDVDRDGYDVVIDDGEVIRFIQLKTVLKSSKTSSWAVRRKLLCINEPEDFGNLDPNIGRGGAVVLIEVDTTQSDPEFTYYVADLGLLEMLCSIFGETRRKSGAPEILGTRRLLAHRTLQDIGNGPRSGKVILRKSTFLRARNACGLLALLDLYSSIDCHRPSDQFQSLCRNGFRVDEEGQLISNDIVVRRMGGRFVTEFLAIVDEPSLTAHPSLHSAAIATEKL